ncbi:MAG: cytochrome c maturation protein CcmE [Acidimicrobiales bacterium]
MELTPRTAPAPLGQPTQAPRRNPWAYGVLIAVLLGLGVVVWQGLTSASLYFYNADEAVEQRADLGDKRFRLQGTVLGETIEQTGTGVDFTVAFNGVRVDVHHQGDPPELFQPGIPVVLEGRWSPMADTFASDTIKVKHSEEYEAENEDRLEDAEAGASGGSAPNSTEP